MKKELPRGGGVVLATNLIKKKIVIGKDGKVIKTNEDTNDSNQK